MFHDKYIDVHLKSSINCYKLKAQFKVYRWGIFEWYVCVRISTRPFRLPHSHQLFILPLFNPEFTPDERKTFHFLDLLQYKHNSDRFYCSNMVGRLLFDRQLFLAVSFFIQCTVRRLKAKTVHQIRSHSEVKDHSL